MAHKTKSRGRVALFVLCSYLLTLPTSAYSLSLLNSDVQGNEREFFATNSENRFLLKVHVLGDVPLSGVHHVPENSSLLDVISYAGGPQGGLREATITLNRASTDGKESVEVKMTGESLVRNGEFRNMPLTNGDVIYLDVPKTDQTVRTLTIVSIVVGIVSTSATLYLLSTR